MFYDVAVIGCGVVGALTARELTRYNLKVCMLEKENDVAMGASKANSGIVHAGFDAHPGSLKAKFNVRGNRMMPGVCRMLGVKYKNNGSLVIAFSAEDMEHIHELYERGQKNRVPDLEILDAGRVHEMEPALSDKVCGALYAKTGGIVCPYGLTIAAAGNAMDNGAELLLNFEVSAVSETPDGYRITASSGRNITAKYVVNSAGLFSDAVAAMVGDTSFKVHPRAGEYMILDKASAGLCTATVFRTPTKMGKGILVSPTADGNILLGPTSVDTDDKTDKSTTPEGLSQIAAQAFEDTPSVPLRSVITSFTGLRAVGDTGDFILRLSAKNFITLGGIESPGLTSAPALAKEVVRMLKQQCGMPTQKNPAFNGRRKAYYRFGEMSPAAKNRMIRKNPDFGTIVCRCEGITKGEILEALAVNPPARDLDGIKRRTRSGMGRCQGGFCSPVIARMIAEYNRIPFESVTKKGPGSELNIGKTK
ncbi:MAG: NAD(P)/FAD-dependent oxidoreductase [Eubacteriales bacterium]